MFTRWEKKAQIGMVQEELKLKLPFGLSQHSMDMRKGGRVASSLGISCVHHACPPTCRKVKITRQLCSSPSSQRSGTELGYRLQPGICFVKSFGTC